MTSPHDAATAPPHPLDALVEPFRARRSGVLQLDRGAGRRRVFYHQGEVVQADSDLPKESLLHALEARGIDGPLRARAEAAAREGPTRPLQVLVDAGAISPDDVRTLLRRRAEHLVAASLAWRDATCAFRPSAGFPPLTAPPTNVTLPRVLMAGAARYLADADVTSLLRPSWGARPRGAPAPPVPIPDLGLGAAQFDFFCSLDGARGLDEVLSFSVLPREEAARLVLLLHRLGAVVFDPPAAAAPPPSPSRARAGASGDPLAGILVGGSDGSSTSTPPAVHAAGSMPSPAAPEPDPDPGRGGLDAVALFGPGIHQVKAPTVRRPAQAPADLEIDDLTGADLSAVRDLVPSDRQRYFALREQVERAGGQSHFERLGLGPDAGEAEIRNAYFALARRYHPDALHAFAEPIRDAAGTLFAKCTESYEVLSDPETRRRYVDRVVHGKPDENEQAMLEVRAIIDAEQAFKRGLKLMNAGKLLDAHQDFARAVELYPQEHEYAVYAGFTTFKLNHPKDPEAADRGEAAIRQALKQNTRLEKGWHLLGRVMMAKENWEQAKLFLRQAIKLQPANGEAVRDYKHCDARLASPASSSPLAGLFGRFKKS